MIDQYPFCRFNGKKGAFFMPDYFFEKNNMIIKYFRISDCHTYKDKDYEWSEEGFRPEGMVIMVMCMTREAGYG